MNFTPEEANKYISLSAKAGHISATDVAEILKKHEQFPIWEIICPATVNEVIVFSDGTWFKKEGGWKNVTA